jgi:glyoxylase-like metal-dependent hydrolase (beta-lactamase superfamily II)
MKLQTIVVGPFDVNCYLYWDEQSRDAVVIDPGGDEQLIIDAVEHSGASLRAILLTHGHGDHIAAVEAVKKKFAVPLYAAQEDAHLLSEPSELVATFYGRPVTAPPPDHYVTDEQLLTLGSINLRVLATPGHTPGGVCYLDEREGLLFCGDTLFSGSIGRTDLPGGSYEQLIASIQQKILTLPDEIVCLPGHGPQTTVGAERSGNPFLRGGYVV